MIRKTLVIAAVIAAAFTGTAQAAKPSAFVAGFQFCHAFDTKTLAMRFDVKPTKAAVSAQVGRWFTCRSRATTPATATRSATRGSSHSAAREA
jgi:hypothetical protein